MHTTRHPSENVSILPYIERLKRECCEWRHQLDCMLRENTRRKNVLAQIVQKNTFHIIDHLEEAEQFQNDFLHLEAALKLMRVDINQQEKKLNDASGREEVFSTGLRHLQRKLRHEMVALDSEFQTIRFSFYSYVASRS